MLDFPDLTVDGSFPLGAAVVATAITGGHRPVARHRTGDRGRSLAGLVTAVLNVRFKILHLLASILTMIALYSINLRIMGRPNIALLARPPCSRRSRLGLPRLCARPLCLAVVVAVVRRSC